MNSENDFSILKDQIKFKETYSEKDWQKDVKEFGKLSVTLSDEYSEDLAEFMLIMVNSNFSDGKKKEMFNKKYKLLNELIMTDLGPLNYLKFVTKNLKKSNLKNKDKKNILRGIQQIISKSLRQLIYKIKKEKK